MTLSSSYDVVRGGWRQSGTACLFPRLPRPAGRRAKLATPLTRLRSNMARRHPPALLRQPAAHAYTPDCRHPPRTTAQEETCRPYGLTSGLTCTVASGLVQTTLMQKGGCVGGCAGASRTPLRSVPSRIQGRGCPSPTSVGPLARPGEFRVRLDGAERNGYPWQRQGRSARSRNSPRHTRLSQERKAVPNASELQQAL